ncbi:MAG: ribonuclease P protein component [Candidatus Saccharibacteria bacterium]|nr:ribonuclease P protein component [Candidatus Saccharibacteria bacterium]
MLSHRNRFHGHGSLRYLYQHGTKSRSRDFGLYYIENKNRTHSRFAIVVSKKVHKSAVKRNRIRRRIYEIIRLEMDSIKNPYDFIITVFTPELVDIEPAQLKKLLVELLVKEKLIS